MNTLRHGDWNLKPVKKIEGELIFLEKNEFTFAVGEASNHYHTAHADISKMHWYKLPDGSYVVKNEEVMILTHPEHSEVKDLVVPPGIYKVYQRREKDWLQMQVRRVVD